MAIRTKSELKNLFKRGRVLFTSFVDLIDTIFAAGETNIENGTFTLSADGMSATGGVLVNPGTNPKLKITTTKKLKLWQGLVFKTVSTTVYSDGRSDGIIQNCTANKPVSVVNVDINNCINVEDGTGNAWVGLITSIRDTEFDITFIKQGLGLDITGKWHGIMV